MLSYAKRLWQLNVTKLGPTEFNRMEDGIAAAVGIDYVTAIIFSSGLNPAAPGTAAVAFPTQTAPAAGDQVLIVNGPNTGIWVWNGDSTAMTLVKSGANIPRGHHVTHIPNNSSAPMGLWLFYASTFCKLVAGIEPWHNIGASGEPAFANSWSNIVSASYPPLRYRKDAHGRVNVEGAVTRATAGQAAITTLPAGYRPDLQKYLNRAYGWTGSAVQSVVQTINAAGQITVGGDTNNSEVWIDLTFFAS